MSTINIAGLTPVEDPAYRYKMPRLVVKVEGRGNGIKTVLMNVIELAQSLNREAPEITKFFGCEIGSQTTYATDTDRAIVNGAHRDTDLQNHLSRYIENFVLCKNCRLPETHYKIKDGLISQKCLACGSKNAVDMTHKLTAFILAQHKKAKDAAKAAEKGKGKAKKEKSKKKHKDEGDDGAQDDSKLSPVTNKDGSDKKSCKDSVDKKSSKKDKKIKASSSSDNVFGIIAASPDEEEEEESDSKAADDGMERFKLWLSNVSGTEVDPTPPTTSQIVDELRNIQTMASLRTADRVIIFLGAVFTENMITLKEVEKNASVLKALAGTHIQQRHLIAAFEWLFGTKYPSKVKFFPMALKQLMDEDLVEEDVFLEWAADYARNEFSAESSMICLDTLEELRASAAPFIKWLQEAEEEGDDEDEEEDEDEG